MYIASATTRTGYVARGIAGKEAASCVHSHQTAASDILFGGHFYDHVACGIASGQSGTRIRLTCHAADIDRSLHCGRGAASGDGTFPLSTHYTADVHRAADAARHRAVFNGAVAISCHAAGKARTAIACYLYVLHHHVLHRTGITDRAEQTHKLVICRNGQPLDGMTATVEGAGVFVAETCAYRRLVFACEVNVSVEGNVNVALTSVH